MRYSFIAIVLLWGSVTLFSQNQIEELQKHLKSSDIFIKNRALNVSVSLYNEALPLLPQLIEILSQNNNQNSYLAIQAIGNIGKKAKSAIPHLIKSIEKSTDFFLRYHAIVALGMIRDLSAKECIVKAIKDKNPHIRSSAIIALNNINPPNFLQIIKLLAKDKQIPVQKAILQSLVHRKQTPETTEILLTGIQHSDNVVQFHATQILQITSLNAEKIIPIYLNLLNSRNPKIVINVLVDFRNAKQLAIKTLPTILKLLKKKNLSVYVRNAIAKIGIPNPSDIEKLLSSPNAYERQQTVILISQLKQTPNYLQKIVKMGVEDANKLVRNVCVNALRMIKSVPDQLKNYIAISIPQSADAILMVGELQLAELVPLLQQELKTDSNSKKEIYKAVGKLIKVNHDLVSILVEGLQDKKFQKTIMHSIGNLKEKGAPAVTKLTQIAQIDNENFTLAIITLGKIGTKAAPALPQINEVFQKSKVYIHKYYCLNAMKKIGDAATPYFINGLKSSQAVIRTLSTNGLLHMTTNQKVIIALEDMLKKEQNKTAKRKARQVHKQLKKRLKNNK
ncbi:HEAT repeat domain-containing protein [Candidatus Uabimicrobium sp. HlEnr_7]|uniref:HEAT repeat domain-containing protein n=1 Tax=Candidatus Uabimicrobium helgolandensis TaxID=3095367 RepID=UPI003558B261